MRFKSLANPNYKTRSCQPLHPLISLICFIIVASQLVSLAPAQSDPSKPTAVTIPRIQRIELLNGLRVLSVEKPGETAVINLLVKSGSQADPKDKAGLANLTAQGVCFANAKLPFQRWKDELEFLGARIEIHLSGDSTVFQAHVSSSNVEGVITLFARLLVRPVFTEEGLDRIKCELRASKLVVSEPRVLAQLRLSELVFGRSACARTKWGTLESIDALRLPDLGAFHQAHYIPNNTALIVVGGPPIARLGDLVREKFGSWIKAKLQPTDVAVTPMPARPVVRVINNKVPSDALIVVGHAAPARQTPDFFALSLANTLLSGLGKASRLEQAFAKKQILHQALDSELELKQACGFFRVLAQTSISAVPAAFAAMLESIEDLKTHPVSETELSQAKSALLLDHRTKLETEAGLADQVTAIELFDLARDYLSGFALRIDQVSAERVQEAAKNYLSSTQISGVVVGEGQSVKAGLAEFRTFEISEWQESVANPVNAN